MVSAEYSQQLIARDIYKLHLIRACEEIVVSEYYKDEMKTPVHLSHGAEAIAVGVLSALSDSAVFGTYRNHHWYLARTGNVLDFFRELLLRETSPSGGRAGSMHLAAPKDGYFLSSAVVSSTISIAAGYAWSQRLLGSTTQTVVFFGDGAIEEGTFFETLNIARLKSLPITFVCEDNGLAIHSPKANRQAFDIKALVQSFGIPYCFGRATNLFEIRDDCSKFVGQTSGPRFIHWHYHRRLEHVGVKLDYAAGYRSEPTSWQNDLDPLTTSTRHAVERGAVSAEEIQVLALRASRDAREAFEVARREPLGQCASSHVLQPRERDHQ